MDDVEAIILTHGHEDHIGAVPFLLRLRQDIRSSARSSRWRSSPRSAASTVCAPTSWRWSRATRRRTVRSSASTSPSTTRSPTRSPSRSARRPAWCCHTGDIKLDQLPLDGRLTDLAVFSRLGDEGVDLFLVDSTNAEVRFRHAQREIGGVLDNVIGKATQRVIVASFASHVHRIQQVVDVAKRYNRRVAFVGRSMVRNMQIAQTSATCRCRTPRRRHRHRREPCPTTSSC